MYLYFQDGGSTDGTDKLIEKYIKAHDWISFSKSLENGGVDLDTNLGVMSVDSDYIWLFSSDDLMDVASLRKLEEVLTSHKPDIFLASRTNYSKDLGTCYGHQKWFRTSHVITEFVEGDFLLSNYIDSTISLGGIFSYMPSIIILRDRWTQETDHIPSFMNGTNYRHVLLMLKVMRNGALLYSDPTPFILCRSFNDSFHQSGSVGRFILDFEGYDKVIKGLGNTPLLEKAIHSCVRRELNILRILRLIGSISSPQEIKELHSWLLSYDYNSFFIFIFTLLTRYRLFRKLLHILSSYYFQLFK